MSQAQLQSQTVPLRKQVSKAFNRIPGGLRWRQVIMLALGLAFLCAKTYDAMSPLFNAHPLS